MHRGQIICSQLLIVLYHKLQAPTLPCDCFPRTKQHQTQCGEVLLQRGVGLCHSRSFKIWSFVFQENCGTGCAHGSGTDKLKAGISLGHQREVVHFSLRAFWTVSVQAPLFGDGRVGWCHLSLSQQRDWTSVSNLAPLVESWATYTKPCPLLPTGTYLLSKLDTEPAQQVSSTEE